MRGQRGFSLLEMAVSVMVLGLVSVLVWQFIEQSAQRQRYQASLALLQQADAALIGFAAAMRRLPCPDTDGDGLENCGAAQVGRLPWQTLGLPATRMAQVRYGALNRDASADLMSARSYFSPMRVQNMVAVSWPRSQVRNLDFCHAVHNAGLLPQQDSALHIVQPDGGRRAVAYALALPGSPNGFAGVHAGNDPVFESPRRLRTAHYHDAVMAVNTGQLWQRLSCGELLAAAGHAHFNSAAMAAILHQSGKDYVYQLGVYQRMATIAAVSAGAGVANSAAGVGNAITSSAIAVADALVTQGSTSGIIAAAAAAVAAKTAASVSATVALGLATAAAIIYDQHHADSIALAERLAALSSQVDAAALHAVESGY